MKSQIVPLVFQWLSPEQCVIVKFRTSEVEGRQLQRGHGKREPWTTDIFLAGHFREEYIYKLKNESLFLKMTSVYILTEKSSCTQLGGVCVPLKKKRKRPIFQSISKLGTLYITVGIFSIRH